MKKAVYKIQGMDCEACAKMIEIDLEDAGISAKCSYAKQTLEIEGEKDLDKVINVVRQAGYKLSE